MDIDVVEDLIRLLQRSAVSELEVSANGLSVKLRRGQELPPEEDEPEAQASDLEGAPEPAAAPLHRICAAMVGIYRHADGLAPGMTVQPGQVVGLIESMKLMNELTASVGGTVEELLVEDGSPVEYGQLLMTLKEEG
ncbi:MAG: biotin/lipoyl-binding protein [Armatimonadetes bacterium]|nr:biotin/lipoyl-binding protein [Armatimonadota bacterium]